MLVKARIAVVLATLFVTSAQADCGADMKVEAVMIVDVMAAIARRRDDDDDDEFSSDACEYVAGSDNGRYPLSMAASSLGVAFASNG